MSFYEQLLMEAAGPLVVVAQGHEFHVEVPCADDVCQLDETIRPHDVLDLLTGDAYDGLLDVLEDQPASETIAVADQVREHFALLHLPPEGITAVVEEIDLYGEAIEYDLVGLGLDLHDWVRHHAVMPWAKLLRLTARLPPGSHYSAARAVDEDLARRIAELEANGTIPKPSKRPSLIGWTAEREQLTGIADALRYISHGIYAASPKFKGTGGAAPKPSLRPRTAFDVVHAEQRLVEHDDIMSALLGSRYTPMAGERAPSPEAVRGAVLLDP